MRGLHPLFGALGIVIALAGTPVAAQPNSSSQVPARAQRAASVAVTVAKITLGKALMPDLKVQSETATFGRNDTIYAVIDTYGSGDATLKVKWTYQGADKVILLNERSQNLRLTTVYRSEFHVSNPPGWPQGAYQVEVFLNDKPAGVRKFSVK